MATSNYPASLDTTSALPASISDTANLNSPNHAEMHEVYNDAIIEIEEKVGIGDTTPTDKTVLVGTGTGQSAWSATAIPCPVSVYKSDGGAASKGVAGNINTGAIIYISTNDPSNDNGGSDAVANGDIWIDI
jgi:hypothetical protein